MISNRKLIVSRFSALLLASTLLLLSSNRSGFCRPQAICAFDCPAVTNEPSRRVYFYETAGDEAQLLALKQRLAGEGAYHINLFPPSIIVCMLPDAADAGALIRGTSIGAIPERELRARKTAAAIPHIDFLRECYAMAERIASSGEERIRRADIEGIPAGYRDTVLVIPQEEIDRLELGREQSGPAVPDTRRFYQNAEFMIGDIVINLILPECNFWYSNQQWTDELLAGALKGAIAGMLWFQEKYTYAPLNFIVRSYPKVRIPYEPIHTSIEDHDLWINECITTIDPSYSATDPAYLAVHRFNTDLMKYYDADWVFTAFIVNSHWTKNQMFFNASYIAYALLGGPYLVMPYPTGPVYFNPDESYRMAAYLKHEVGHIFWALDEWQFAQGDCENFSGYLNYINGYFIEDIVNGGPVNTCDDPWFACFMQYPEWTSDVMCRFTAGHMGLIDADENGVADVFDSSPVIEFEGGAVETVLTDTCTVRGRAHSVPILNRNSKQDSTKRRNYAATLKDAVMNIDGFGNLYLLPEDGYWDDIAEDLVIPLKELNVGITSVEISVRTTAGYKSQPIVKKIYRVGLVFSLYEAIPRNDGIDLSWYVIGESFDAVFDLYRIDLSGGPADTVLVAAALQPAGEPENRFVHYTYFDSDIEPLKTYGYFICGTYELTIQGSAPQTFVTDSKIFKASSILPIRAGEMISAILPNPFSSSTSFSIDIPKNYEQGGAGTDAPPGGSGETVRPSSALQYEIPTPVEVAVYDVLGRKLATLLSDRFYGKTISLQWDGRTGAGILAPSGIYFLKVAAGQRSEVKKVVIVR